MLAPILCAEARLKQMLLKLSYKKGTFKLTSGRESDFYVDGKKTVLDGEGSFLVGACFYSMIRNFYPDAQAVAGVTLGADPLITATSLIAFQRGRSLPQIIIRKEAKKHGTGNQLEAAATVSENANVILLDDVLTTGGTLLKIGIPALERAGYKVLAILVVVDREEGGRQILEERGYGIRSILTRTELLA
ncbi:MAG: orotate phosphoribosyltransferase [Candidatus Moranbacteria bacterium]|nr:orotate phosphoribosyltransferase [Candidatus Moranbacteria bacterium]